MYLSYLLIDIGDNPDRPRPGRSWLRNLYRVHQRLCMAFPSAARVAEDADFLQPFIPDDFGKKQVQVTRQGDAGFLFRIDQQPGGRAMILVQSGIAPNWDYAFHNAGHLLVMHEVKPFNPAFTTEQPLRFRLLANPTRKIDTKSGADGRRRNGKRVPVPDDRLFAWLAGHGERAGFVVREDAVTMQPGYLSVVKPGPRSGDGQDDGDRAGCAKVCFRSVRFDGLLTVTDPASFREAIVGGIGSGKGFGFGLLSVARG